MPGAAQDVYQPLQVVAQQLVHAGYRGAAIMECGRGADDAYNMKRFRDYMRWLLEDYVPGVPVQ